MYKVLFVTLLPIAPNRKHSSVHPQCDAEIVVYKNNEIPDSKKSNQLLQHTQGFQKYSVK
jgi:hypothetical protein